MKKFFESKIIIGSIIGFLTTTIGLIAIFFPNLLNLEMQRIEKFKCNIDENDWKTVQSLKQYLLSKTESEKHIFLLQIEGDLDNGDIIRKTNGSTGSKKNIETFNYEICGEDNNLEISFLNYSKYATANREESKNNIINNGIVFIFEGQNQSQPFLSSHRQYVTNAYFIFQDMYECKNIKKVIFKKVPDEMIRSKKY